MKFLSTFAVGLIIMLLVYFLASTVMKKSLKRAEEQYMESCNQVLKGYSNSINFYLENYHTSLSSIFYRELFEESDVKKIHKWLMDNVNFLHKDISITFWYDVATRVAYFSQGNIIHMGGRKDYLENANFENSSYYVSDIVYSVYFDYAAFVVEEPYFDKNGELKGILCAVIKIDKLFGLTEGIDIEENCTAYMVDRNGRFLIHPDRSYIGKVFVPKNEKYVEITSKRTAVNKNEVVETENEKGEIVDLFSTPVGQTGWVLSIAYPKSYIQKVYSQQNSTKQLIIAVSVISLLLLLFLEMLITDYFYKRQMIDTIYDPLTKLWTRQKFEEEAHKILHHNRNGLFMLVEADIRSFKFLNTKYGEDNADKVLYYYSTLLNRVVVKHSGIIGRGYADHFYGLIYIKDIKRAMSEFRKEIDVMNEEIKKYDVNFFPQFGITFVSRKEEHDVSVKKLIGQASFAKSTIKDNMMVSYSLFNSHLLEKIKDQRYMESRMEKALEDGEFFVMYQPKILLSDDKLVGAEALVRWSTPDKGLIMPNDFIPLFEKNGFITKLDFYVYEEVFKFISAQLKEGKPIVPISVNMSRNHNKPDKFMREFMEIFNKYKIPPHLIQIEIIERSFMDKDTLAEITNSLHKKGFSVAMDDFGSGESSLNMLTKVPVDVLKFDREFLLSSVKDDGSLDEKSAKFIQILVDMSKHLEKETVFEGVETQMQRDFLRSINCDQVQGYFYSKPLKEEDFISFMSKHI